MPVGFFFPSIFFPLTDCRLLPRLPAVTERARTAAAGTEPSPAATGPQLVRFPVSFFSAAARGWFQPSFTKNGPPATAALSREVTAARARRPRQRVPGRGTLRARKLPAVPSGRTRTGVPLRGPPPRRSPSSARPGPARPGGGRHRLSLPAPAIPRRPAPLPAAAGPARPSPGRGGRSHGGRRLLRRQRGGVGERGGRRGGECLRAAARGCPGGRRAAAARPGAACAGSAALRAAPRAEGSPEGRRRLPRGSRRGARALSPCGRGQPRLGLRAGAGGEGRAAVGPGA